MYITNNETTNIHTYVYIYIVYIVYGLEFKTDPIFSIQRALIYESVMTCSSVLCSPAKVKEIRMDRTILDYPSTEERELVSDEGYDFGYDDELSMQPIINYQESLDDYEDYIEEKQAIELPENIMEF